ncbi:DUF3179 domain-containing protein [Rhodobacterales bacterium HKCCSP123]|nr:DUF3179 domain-containing protein [Rhodobacterales bacterium HKCCSP123]
MKPLILAPGLAATLLAASLAAQSPGWDADWPDTDFDNRTVELSEIRSGGVPRDGIPSVEDPAFLRVAQETRLDAAELVVTLALPGEVPRAYPIRYLTWHEIVNDTVGGRPVAVTFCPLCNSALAFDRRVDGRVLEFGVSGNLRNSDLVMYDRQTGSWWQQATGEGIVGEMAGADLAEIPIWMESWESYRSAYPDGLVMDEPDARRPYGRNPYVGYDGASRPFLYSGEDPPHGIAPLARIVRVGARAWPLERLAREREITEAGVTISWAAGQASALDTAEIAEGRDIGQIRVRDAQGRDLVHDVMFAFAFHAFWPDGSWMLGN